MRKHTAHNQIKAKLSKCCPPCTLQQWPNSYLLVICVFSFFRNSSQRIFSLKTISGVQRVKTTEVKAKCPRPSFPAACVLGCIFLSCVLTAVIFKCASTCPLLFQQSFCSPQSLLLRALKPWCMQVVEERCKK